MDFSGVDWTPFFNAVLLALTALLIAMKGPLARFLSATASRKIDEMRVSQHYLLADTAVSGVKMAQRMSDVSTEKKAMASRYVMDQLAAIGITLSPDVIDEAVEAALSDWRFTQEDSPVV